MFGSWTTFEQFGTFPTDNWISISAGLVDGAGDIRVGSKVEGVIVVAAEVGDCEIDGLTEG